MAVVMESSYFQGHIVNFALNCARGFFRRCELTDACCAVLSTALAPILILYAQL